MSLKNRATVVPQRLAARNSFALGYFIARRARYELRNLDIEREDLRDLEETAPAQQARRPQGYEISYASPALNSGRAAGSSEDGVDEGRQRRTLREDEQRAH